MVNILDGLVILAVHVENVQERLVDVLVALEPALNLVDEVDGLDEIDGLLLVLQPDCKALGQEGVEPEDQLGVPVEERLDADNHPVGVDPLALEVAHDLEELLVLCAVVLELVLDGLEVDERVVGRQLLAGGAGSSLGRPACTPPPAPILPPRAGLNPGSARSRERARSKERPFVEGTPATAKGSAGARGNSLGERWW